MTTYRQLTFDDAAPVEMDVLRHILAVETAFHAELVSTQPAQATRSQVPPRVAVCPLCRGHLTDDICDKCGMEVDL